MRIIITGAGEVGIHLAKLMSEESQDIVLIDTDKERLQYAENHIDVITLKGDATSTKVLLEANVANAALLITATSSETTNITAAIIGKKLGAKRTIARISNTEFLTQKDLVDFKSLGIDNMISPEELAAKEIKRLVKQSALTDTFDFDRGKLSLAGLTLDPGSGILNKSVMELASENPDLKFMPIAVQRNNQTIIPRGGTRFQLNDHAYFVAPPGSVTKLLQITGKEMFPIKNVMILGGSRIGHRTASLLMNKYNVKLIESDREKCFDLVDVIPECLIINGDGRNVELLEEENISGMDAFIAVTGDSETNIMSCLVAKAKGVRKTIALVENIDYIHLSQMIGIDTMINKKLLAANDIFRYVRQGEVRAITNLHGVEGEILEFEVKLNSKITHGAIKDLNFPENAVIGGVIRKGSAHIPLGNFEIKAGDRVVVFCLMEAISQIEKFFK